MSIVKIVPLIGLAGVAGWVIAKPADDRPVSADAALQEKIRVVAKSVNAITPKKLGDGLYMQSVRAEGKTLIIKMSGLPQWEPTYTTAEMARIIAVGACENPGVRRAVGEGARIRIDAQSPTGATLPSLPIDRCA